MIKLNASERQKESEIIQGLCYAIFKADSLQKNPVCVKSTLDHFVPNKSYSIYSNQSLLRVLAKRVNLLTKDLTDKLFESIPNSELTIILNWQNNQYAFVTLDLSRKEHVEHLSSNQKEIVDYFHTLLESSI